MVEELGDLLLQVIFHCQLARERGAFDFEKVARAITDKLIRRHPHVFGNVKVKNVDPGLGQLGKDQTRGEAWNQTCPAFRPGRHSGTFACVAPGRKNC